MGKLLEKRWVCVLLSVLLAIAFWAYVRAAVDPNGTINIHNVRVEATGTSVLASQGLAISEMTPQVVELQVEGPNSARADLLRNRSGLYVRVDVSSCVEGENTLRFREVWPEGINYDDLTAQRSTVTIKVEKLYSKTFDIQFRLEGKVERNSEELSRLAEIEKQTAAQEVRISKRDEEMKSLKHSLDEVKDRMEKLENKQMATTEQLTRMETKLDILIGERN